MAITLEILGKDSFFILIGNKMIITDEDIPFTEFSDDLFLAYKCLMTSYYCYKYFEDKDKYINMGYVRTRKEAEKRLRYEEVELLT